jgi:hypothetical protein
MGSSLNWDLLHYLQATTIRSCQPMGIVPTILETDGTEVFVFCQRRKVAIDNLCGFRKGNEFKTVQTFQGR